MFSLFRSNQNRGMGLALSRLYDQRMFYEAFLRDLRGARQQIIIESPFITQKRLNTLLPVLNRLQMKGVKIVVNTKPLHEHDDSMKFQAAQAITKLQDMNITVLMTVGHHRKIAIIDNDVLWEGSLNILSQNDSCEYMRRTQSTVLVAQMLNFTGLTRWSKML